MAWSQLELVKYNVPVIMKDMQKPCCVITGENAWSKPSSEEVFAAVPDGKKEMHVIPEASHFDMDATVLEGLPVEMTAAERGATEQVKKLLKAVGKLSAGETHTDGESKRYDTVM